MNEFKQDLLKILEGCFLAKSKELKKFKIQKRGGSSNFEYLKNSAFAQSHVGVSIIINLLFE